MTLFSYFDTTGRQTDASRLTLQQQTNSATKCVVRQENDNSRGRYAFDVEEYKSYVNSFPVVAIE